MTWKPITDMAELPDLLVPESEYLDYKGAAWKDGEPGSLEIARDVAQFANHLGGTIIVGAAEDMHGRQVSYEVVPDASVVAQRVTDVCHNWLFPRLEIHPVVMATADGKEALVVVNVEPFDGVVAIKPRGKDYHEFYCRFGKGKKPISFDEVERMWTEGRKGRILLSKVPKGSDIYVDATEGTNVHLKGPFGLQMMDDYFLLALELPGPTVSLPYECVRASWPRAGGGWSLALDVEFSRPFGSSPIRAKYVPR